jgi:ABC-2 type transport system ATP-binding protein
VTSGTIVAALEGVHRSYGGRTVLTDVSFEIRRGEILALLGPNGAGKTTTVEIIEGYRRPDRGEVRVLGVDPARAGRDHRARVGLMLQGGGGIDPRLTPREVLALHARFHADPRDPAELLDLVGLDGPAGHTRFRRLSGGERQRAGLALALVGRPELAILDEPTAGMDVEARATTRELLAALRADGVTILLTSHDLVDVERLADRIAILDRGRIVAIGAPDEIGGERNTLRLRLTADLTEADAQDLGVRLGAPTRVRADDRPGHFRLDGVEPSPRLIADLAGWCAERGVTILELRAGGGSLEERYLELTGGAGAAETVP